MKKVLIIFMFIVCIAPLAKNVYTPVLVIEEEDLSLPAVSLYCAPTSGR